MPTFGMQRVPALDGVRGVAILAVVAHHATPVGGAAWARVPHLGWAGVDLFFALSGFLITRLLLDARDRPDYFRRFYARRARRILPLAVVVLGFFVLVDPATRALQAWLWTFTINVRIALTNHWATAYTDHFWTLAIEEQFYLLWPFVVWRADRRTLVRVCVAVAVVSMVLRAGLALAGVPLLSVAVSTPTRADALALGALAACGVRMPGWLVRAAAVVLLAVAAVDVAGSTQAPLLWAVIGYAALAVVAAAAVAHASRSDWAPPAWLTRTGAYAYGLYVIHIPLFAVFRLAGWPMAVAVPLAFALAALSWRYWESPWLRAGHASVRQSRRA